MGRKLQIAPHLLAELEKKYRLEEVIGAGGMGAVLRAWDKRLERRVAIKVKSVAESVDTLTTERFLFEARIMGRIDHPRLVKIYELGQCEADVYLVCEYLSGGSLADRLEIHPFVDILPACEIACDILEGLAVLHDRKVVHRDLKPENILFGEDGRARVADLGLAKGGDREFETRPGLILGSLHYMSPEHFNGKDVGPKADLYALGTVLFEMIAGRCPYIGETEAETIQRRLTQPAPRLRELQERCPAWLDAVIAQLLEKDPTDRQQTAWDVIEVIRRGMNEPLPPPSGSRESGTRTTVAPRSGRAKSSATREVPSSARAAPPAATPSMDATQLAPALKSSDFKKPAKSPRKPKSRAPAILGLAGVALLLAFLGRRGASGELSVTVHEDRINVTGQVKGTRAVRLVLENERGVTVGEKEVLDPQRGIEVAISLGQPASEVDDVLVLKLISGASPLLVQPLPRLEGPWTFPQLGSFTLEGAGLADRTWEATFEGALKGGGLSPPHRLTGVMRKDQVIFEQATPDGWTRGSLLEVVGWPVAGEPAPLRVTRIGFEVGRSFPSRQELVAWLPTHLARGSKKGTNPEDLVEEAFRSAFGQRGERKEEARVFSHARIGTSLRRFLSPGGASLEKQLEVFLWLQPMLLAESWARDWDLASPLDVSGIAGAFVPLERAICPKYDLQELHVLADFEQPEGVFTEGLTMMAREGFIAKRFMLPEEPGRPPELALYGDPKIYLRTAEVTLAGGREAGGGERVGLRLAIMNLHRTFSLRFHFRETPSIRIDLTNPANWGNIDNPTGPLTYTVDNWSWKNIPQHTVHYQYVFPRKVFPTTLPGGIHMEYVTIPGLKRQADRYAYLLRAEWFDPP